MYCLGRVCVFNQPVGGDTFTSTLKPSAKRGQLLELSHTRRNRFVTHSAGCMLNATSLGLGVDLQASSVPLQFSIKDTSTEVKAGRYTVFRYTNVMLSSSTSPSQITDKQILQRILIWCYFQQQLPNTSYQIGGALQMIVELNQAKSLSSYRVEVCFFHGNCWHDRGFSEMCFIESGRKHRFSKSPQSVNVSTQ